MSGICHTSCPRRGAEHWQVETHDLTRWQAAADLREMGFNVPELS